MEIGRLEQDTIMDIEDQKSFDDRLVSEFGSDILKVQTLGSSHDEIPKTFTQAWVQAPNYKSKAMLHEYQQSQRSSRKSNEGIVGIQGIKAPIRLKQADIIRGFNRNSWNDEFAPSVAQNSAQSFAKPLNHLLS